jgi:pimeloyl-ACP methyl ester carboxylesterase
LSGEIGEADVQNVFCQQELAAQGYPTSGISTANSAADLAEIMATLGYPTYNLYAISYGTRLAMSLMHYFPDDPLVRSVVLDSAYPLPEDQVNDYIAAPSIYQQALFEAVFQACADDSACASSYPDLRARFDALAATLAATPLDLGQGQSFGSDELYRWVYPFNMALNFIAYQPRLIAELEQGDTTTLLLLRSGQVPGRSMVTGSGPDVDGFSDLLDAYLDCSAAIADSDKIEEELVAMWDAKIDAIKPFVDELCPGEKAVAVNDLLDSLAPGAFNGIIVRFAPETIQGVNAALNIKLSCTEEYPFREDLEAIEQSLREAGLPGFFVEDTLAAMAANGDGCAVWSDSLTEPTPSTYGDYRVMILSGQFDSITPPEMAGIAASELPKAQLVVVPNATHSILGNYGDCPTQIVQEFLVDPAQPVNAICTAEMGVPWVMPSDLLPGR